MKRSRVLRPGYILARNSIQYTASSIADWLISHYSQHLLGGSFKLRSGIVDNAKKDQNRLKFGMFDVQVVVVTLKVRGCLLKWHFNTKVTLRLRCGKPQVKSIDSSCESGVFLHFKVKCTF